MEALMQSFFRIVVLQKKDQNILFVDHAIFGSTEEQQWQNDGLGA